MIKPPSEVAHLIAENALLFSNEKQRQPLDFWTMNRPSIRQFSGHMDMIPRAFLDELEIELRQLGLIMFALSDLTLAFVQRDKVQTWVKLGPSRALKTEGESQ